MKKSIVRYTGAFLFSVILAVGLLLLGACLPQQPIDTNVLRSSQGMVQEGDYPMIADKSFASMLDYTTDALILAESKATTISQWETIFTNPLYEQDGNSTVENLYQYALNGGQEPSRYYVQYWMGFRPAIRLLLSFLDYYQILRYTAFAFFVLLAAVICDLAKRTDAKTAFLFALSIILVRPHIVSVSLQFSCCFFLAFLAMLLMPWLQRHPKWEALFFLELGIATMYFDFYTTPILTFGLPMTYLYLLHSAAGSAMPLKHIGKNALFWSLGYGGMWLAKLALTSLLTAADGIGTGLASFMGRIGITRTSGMESYYNPLTALRTVAASLYSDQEGKVLLFAVIAVFFVLLLIKFLRDKHGLRDMLQHKALLVLAALPIIWFMAAAQPTANHHWFQYRGIAVTFWAVFSYLLLTLQRREKPSA